MTLQRNTIAVLTLTGAMATATGAAVWRHATRDPEPAPVLGILHDASGSSAQGCAQVADILRQELPALEAHDAAMLLVFATGSRQTANEPRPLPVLEVPRRYTKVLEKDDSANAREAFLADARQRCDAAGVAEDSPVYRGIKTTVAAVAAVPRTFARRRVIARGDLQETVEPTLKRALRGNRGAAATLAGTIDNRGVEVLLCGYAETRGASAPSSTGRRALTRPRLGRDDELMKQVWTSLFTAPDLVTFSPICFGKARQDS